MAAIVSRALAAQYAEGVAEAGDDDEDALEVAIAEARMRAQVLREAIASLYAELPAPISRHPSS